MQRAERTHPAAEETAEQNRSTPRWPMPKADRRKPSVVSSVPSAPADRVAAPVDRPAAQLPPAVRRFVTTPKPCEQREEKICADAPDSDDFHDPTLLAEQNRASHKAVGPALPRRRADRQVRLTKLMERTASVFVHCPVNPHGPRWVQGFKIAVPRLAAAALPMNGRLAAVFPSSVAPNAVRRHGVPVGRSSCRALRSSSEPRPHWSSSSWCHEDDQRGMDQPRQFENDGLMSW